MSGFWTFRIPQVSELSKEIQNVVRELFKYSNNQFPKRPKNAPKSDGYIILLCLNKFEFTTFSQLYVTSVS